MKDWQGISRSIQTRFWSLRLRVSLMKFCRDEDVPAVSGGWGILAVLHLRPCKPCS